MSARGLSLLLLAAGAAFGGDHEFERIVKAIESHYGAKPLHVPFMGLANFTLKVAHPEGARGFKLAVFEDLHSTGEEDWRERDRFMESVCGPHLKPMMQVHSSRNREATYILIDPESKSSRMLLATFESDEATVIEVQADFDELLRSEGNWGDVGRRYRDQ